MIVSRGLHTYIIFHMIPEYMFWMLRKIHTCKISFQNKPFIFFSES